MASSILITGSEGFVGSNLVPVLAEEHEVIALDYLTSRERSNLPEEIPYLNYDLSKVNASSLPDVDVVIHLASVSIERVAENAMYEVVNIASMLKVLELARRAGAKLILSSSCSVYGDGLNFRESDAFKPMSLYAIGKINEERYAEFYHFKYGLDVTILRYSNCFGDLTYIGNKFYPGKKDVMRLFMEQALAGEPLTVVGGQSRDFTYIDDVVEATAIMLNLDGFNIFNVATGVETRIEDIPPLIGKALSKEIETRTIPPRGIDDLKQRSLNIDRISAFWKPKYDLEEGIKLYAERAEVLSNPLYTGS